MRLCQYVAHDAPPVLFLERLNLILGHPLTNCVSRSLSSNLSNGLKYILRPGVQHLIGVEIISVLERAVNKKCFRFFQPKKHNALH